MAKLLAAAAAVVIVLPLAVVLLAAAGLATGQTGAGVAAGPSVVALDDIPPTYLSLYLGAARTCPGLPWGVLAGIGEVESDHGRSTAPGVHSGVNFAGAEGRCSSSPRPSPSTRSTPTRGDPPVTIDGDWPNAVCDNCYADLHPDMTVTVKYYSVRAPGLRKLVAVIRERTRSDYRYPDIGEDLGWSLFWEHTTILNEERRDGSSYHLEVISRHDAEHHAASLAIRYWTPEAAQLP